MTNIRNTCPTCDGPLERRDFADGADHDGKNADINQDWWCPACKLRWLDMYGPPMEAEG